MNRRSFLTACIATMTAPAIVRASSLMPVSVRPWRSDVLFVWDFETGRPVYSASEPWAFLPTYETLGGLGGYRCIEHDLRLRAVNLNESWLTSLPSLQVGLGAPAPHRIKV